MTLIKVDESAVWSRKNIVLGDRPTTVICSSARQATRHSPVTNRRLQPAKYKSRIAAQSKSGSNEKAPGISPEAFFMESDRFR